MLMDFTHKFVIPWYSLCRYQFHQVIYIYNPVGSYPNLKKKTGNASSTTVCVFPSFPTFFIKNPIVFAPFNKKKNHRRFLLVICLASQSSVNHDSLSWVRRAASHSIEASLAGHCLALHALPSDDPQQDQKPSSSMSERSGVGRRSGNFG